MGGQFMRVKCNFPNNINLNIPNYNYSKGVNIEILKRYDYGFNLAPNKVTHN